MFTPRPKDATLIAVMPTSCTGASTASNSPRIARTNTVSAGNGPTSCACRARRREHAVVLVPEAPAIAGVRVERAERESR